MVLYLLTRGDASGEVLEVDRERGLDGTTTGD
jgi:hypothetical protein